jgi:L-alanine-DL-glutamate epimerase-like enolase superfamily enzyme
MAGLKIATVETIPVSVPYRRREVSSQVARDGVSDVLVKVTTADGLVGWGEACCGADTASVNAALRAMTPFVVERDPWNRDAMRRDVFTHGLWQFRAGTGNFAWAGIDMALWDICGRASEQPLWRLLGGRQQQEATYFYYLARDTPESLAAQIGEGLAAGFEVFYLKVGLGDADDLELVKAAREALGPAPRLRLDANGSWTIPQALRNLAAMGEYEIDFVEQPVRDHPIGQLAEFRARSGAVVCANEGLWSEADAYARIRARDADVYCFSPYWVGSLGGFHRLSWLAHYEGLQVCKHTHGELGLAAAAAHHVVLTLPNGVEGHQQTAYLLEHDILTEPIPISRGPRWGAIDGPGLGVDVDDDAVAEAAARYRRDGQYRPWQDCQLAKEER